MLGRFFSHQAQCGTEHPGTDLQDQIKTIQPLSKDNFSAVDFYTSGRSILRQELLCVSNDAGAVSLEGTCMPLRAASFMMCLGTMDTICRNCYLPFSTSRHYSTDVISHFSFELLPGAGTDVLGTGRPYVVSLDGAWNFKCPWKKKKCTFE